ncbi:serine/threonine protein kinase, partial [bacterium]|nr:serine/threonine protein kinase [bacterium]
MSSPEEFLAKYEIESELGKGGMGVVYRARQVSLDRPVAVKMLAKELAEDERFVRRFTEEARAIARMRNHPNIVEVYDFVDARDNLYIVMELVEGEPLNRLIQRQGRFLPSEAIAILVPVARAIAHAHLAGVIHRDIKPENIIVDKTGRVKVMDFGVAHLSDAVQKTQTGLVLGTPLYMSPEQARGRAIDGRSDIYSLGVLLYHLLTGQPPFDGDTALSIAMKHVSDAPPPPRSVDPSIPEIIEQAILKAMAKNPDDRFQTAGDFADFLETSDVRQALVQVPTQARMHGAATLLEQMPTEVADRGERIGTGTAAADA